ncbi:hypothetical protein VFA_001618 [Vibrio furnissii CIP 102972]|nr:hypothetical protein VFA_001618 [Vibrio furnissii CIP 102972]
MYRKRHHRFAPIQGANSCDDLAPFWREIINFCNDLKIRIRTATES